MNCKSCLLAARWRRIAVTACCTAAAVITVAAGCASVTVRKVPTPTQYIHWTDDMQREADEMQGFRFYLPRPFVNVFESFPVRTDIYFAQGVISPDGAYVLVTKIIPEARFKKLDVEGKASSDVYHFSDQTALSIPAYYIKSTPSTPAPAQPQSGTPDVAAGLLSAALNSSGGSSSIKLLGSGLSTDAVTDLLKGLGGLTPTKESKPGMGLPPQLEPGEKTGIQTQKTTNDNGLSAYQPMRGNMDIAYLPDFEEQYVISSYAGLGLASVEINYGQGWSLQGFNSIVDNSEINRRIFDLIDTAAALGKGLAFAAAGVPFPVELPAAALQSGLVVLPDDSIKSVSAPGTPVTLKIAVVHYAAKGLYPVIKPRELQERVWPYVVTKTPMVRDDKPVLDRDGKQLYEAVQKPGPYDRYCILDLFELFPIPTFASEIDPNAIKAAREASENPSGHATMPRYPYQYLSFNTFRYLAIQVIKNDDRPFLPDKLLDATGTNDHVGQTRTEVAPRRNVTPTPTPKEDPLKNLASLLVTSDESVPLHGLTFLLDSAEADTEVAGKLNVTIKTPTGTAMAAVAQDALESAWLTKAKAVAKEQLDLDEDVVTVVEITNFDDPAIQSALEHEGE